MTAESDASDRVPRRGQRPWLAFLLSLVAPGLGHLYGGHVKQACFALIAWAGLSAISYWLLTAPLGSALAIWAAALLLPVCTVGVAVHAATVAPSRAGLGVRRGLRIGIYVLYVIAISQTTAGAMAWARSNVAEPFHVSSDSMLPTLGAGDYFFADKRVYLERPPARGDVVVISVTRDGGKVVPADLRPGLPREQFVTRIVGVPGDVIRVSAGVMYLNGSAVSVSPAGTASEAGRDFDSLTELLDGRRHAIARGSHGLGPDFPEVDVPRDRYFVMGDNRGNSYDSRYWGTVGRSEILGRVSHLYFALERSTGAIAWARIGMRVE